MAEPTQEHAGSCCSPDRAATERSPAPEPPEAAGSIRPGSGPLVALAAGRFRMGCDNGWAYPGDGEGPVREVTLSAFAIDRSPVTNEAFGSFVDATGYVTEAERFGWSFVFGGLLPEDFEDTRGV